MTQLAEVELKLLNGRELGVVQEMEQHEELRDVVLQGRSCQEHLVGAPAGRAKECSRWGRRAGGPTSSRGVEVVHLPTQRVALQHHVYVCVWMRSAQPDSRKNKPAATPTLDG